MTGVDKIYLTTAELLPEYDSAKWSENSNSQWEEFVCPFTGEIVEEKVTREKKYLNFKDHGLVVNYNDDGLLIHFNPNRILTNTHYEIRPLSDIDEAVDKVQKICLSKHLDIDLSRFKITHIDLCRQAQTKYQFETYISLFRQIMASRLDSYEYPNSYYFENTQSEAVFYDKTYQAKKLFKEKVPSNTMRFEQRFKEGRVVSSIFKANNLDGLKKTDIDAVYNKYAIERIFRREVQLEVYPFITQLEQYVKRGKRNGVMEFLMHLSMASGRVKSIKDAIIETYGTMNELRDALRLINGYSQENKPYQKSKERQNWMRLTKRIEAEDRFYQMNFVNEEIRPINLKDEIIEKFQLTA